jgi:hypothetical protein
MATAPVANLNTTTDVPSATAASIASEAIDTSIVVAANPTSGTPPNGRHVRGLHHRQPPHSGRWTPGHPVLVPVVLDVSSNHYARWCNLILLTLQRYALNDHITSDVAASALPS